MLRMNPMRTYMQDRVPRRLTDVLFVAVFLLFDWVSYIDPLFGLNITPWNPDPALGLAYWLKYGRRAALPWFFALVIGEGLVRDLPAGWLLTLLLSAWLTIGYGLIGEALRRAFSHGSLFDNRRRLLTWLAIVVVGVTINSVIYISLLYSAQLIPAGQWDESFIQFGIGDMVGVAVSMPLIWMLMSAEGRRRLKIIVFQWETAGYVALAITLLWMVLGYLPSAEFRHYYFLFLPIVWAAARQGTYGAGFVAFVLQVGIIAAVRWNAGANIPVVELQMLGAVLALVGFFIGVVVDEQRRGAGDLKYTLRLAAAGEMASALAHELNQPMTALAAYGTACEDLLERGDTGANLKLIIRKMISESGRAADVVRRLRDFFRTGAMRLETVVVSAMVSGVAQQFSNKFRDQDVDLRILPSPELEVIVDRLQIELVLRNMFANALDEVAKQPPENRTITVSTESLAGGRLRVTVEDSGHGISADTAVRLFEPFVSSKSSGLGLGLVLSRAIVEAHGGMLWSEVGDHGIFRFVIPLASPGAKGVT